MLHTEYIVNVQLLRSAATAGAAAAPAAAGATAHTGAGTSSPKHCSALSGGTCEVLNSLVYNSICPAAVISNRVGHYPALCCENPTNARPGDLTLLKSSLRNPCMGFQ